MKFELPLALMPAVKFISKHHAVLFISFITVLLTVAVYMLYLVITIKPSEPPVSTVDQFDTETIEKIRTLHDSAEDTTEIILPSPRANPFIEP